MSNFLLWRRFTSLTGPLVIPSLVLTGNGVSVLSPAALGLSGERLTRNFEDEALDCLLPTDCRVVVCCMAVSDRIC